MPLKNSYSKGARFERELADLLTQRGYMVVRAAGSGVYTTAPDLLAFRKMEAYVFECKAWNSGRLSLRKEQYELLKKWEECTSVSAYVAWRVPRAGWLFIRVSELSENASISLEKARLINRTVDDLV
ncbi:MAG: hypothetical protein N3G76_00675 [Candidatus Micrarchaeota archaeon]|nr:hypothetical protein [Candidatus Micrarchaeota archaeon]